jgi:hypothetical protein
MKKVIISTLATITIIAGSSAFAFSSATDNGPNATMVKMFAKSQDMTDYQQTLAVTAFKQVKVLATTVKSPKDDIKSYIKGLIEQDSIDVNEIMIQYKTWQKQVDNEFEQSLIAIAKLHEDLSVEQRQKLALTIQKMSKKGN